MARAPFFEAPAAYRSQFQWLAAQPVRFDAWQNFKEQSKITAWAVEAAAEEMAGADVSIRSEHTFAATRSASGTGFGMLLLPRSAMFFENLMGNDVKPADIRLSRASFADLITFLLDGEVWQAGVVAEPVERIMKCARFAASPCNSVSSWLAMKEDSEVVFRLLAADVIELSAASEGG